MKKIILTCAVLFTLQTLVFSQVRFGITAGLSLANMYAKAGDEKDHGKTKAGITAGITADIPVQQNVSFQPSLHFVQKGTTEEATDAGQSFTTKLNLNYLELPLNVVYKLNTSSGKIFFGAGPTFAFGLSGKASIESEGQKLSSDVDFGSSDEDDFKRFDFGANVLAGFEASMGVTVSINYNYGFSNILVNSDSDQSLKNRYFGIRIGYLFNNAFGNK